MQMHQFKNRMFKLFKVWEDKITSAIFYNYFSETKSPAMRDKNNP